MSHARHLTTAIFAATFSWAAAAASFEEILLPPPMPAGPVVQPYVKVAAGHVALTHVLLIDGTGGPTQPDRTVILDNGKIAAITSADTAPPAGTTILDMSGHTVMPGLVGMHDHMYYIATPNLDALGHSEPPRMVPEMLFSSPRLYLANGVTTLRTTGSVEPYTDLNLKKQIDGGILPGPHMDVTAPYLEGPGSPFVQMHQLRDVEDAKKTVAFWAEQGATSFKAYMNIHRDELKAAIDEAHKHGLKVTGHLCSVTYPEAIAAGIDDLEHGFFVNTQNDPGKKPDECIRTAGDPTLLNMDPDGDDAGKLIANLVSHHVAITSTLPVFEQRVPLHAPLRPKAMAVLTPEAREAYLYLRNLAASVSPEQAKDRQTAYRHDLALERRLVAAGGLLLAGPDPTGNGGTIPGFADLREVELLVEAGLSPTEAIRIATLNGAVYLGLQNRIGSIAVGKDADLMVVKGDPTHDIAEIQNVELVFKDGVGYDSAALLESVRGRYGQY